MITMFSIINNSTNDHKCKINLLIKSKHLENTCVCHNESVETQVYDKRDRMKVNLGRLYLLGGWGLGVRLGLDHGGVLNSKG